MFFEIYLAIIKTRININTNEINGEIATDKYDGIRKIIDGKEYAS